MLFTLILENAIGDRVDMTTTANQYMTSKIEGLNPPTGTISTSGYAGMSGSYLNNAFIEKRNVVISFAMRGIGIEKRRHQLYRVVKPSRYIKIYYRTANINVYAEGYVESCELNSFEQPISGQISIICPDIYWYSTESLYAYYSSITGAFTFPFSIDENGVPLGNYQKSDQIIIQNDGDETGFTIVLETQNSEDVPEVAANTPTIYRADSGEYLQIVGDVLKGDIITITTKNGNKTVTLTRGGESFNIINRLASGSTWFQLNNGENTFTVQCQKGLKNIKVKMIHTNAYLGV